MKRMSSLACSMALLMVLAATANAQIVESFEVDSLSNNKKVTTPVKLLLPVGDGPFPAMVQIHGSGGPNITLMHNLYGRQLNEMGVAVTVSNSFVNRGVKDTVQQQGAVTHNEMMLDAYKILEYLTKHSKIDPKRIGIFGFSKGGTVAFYTAFTENADWLLPNGPRFALHVPFYPGCVNNSYYVKTNGAPILVLLGGADDYTDPKTCLRMVEKVKATGSPIEAIIYPGAQHSWDSAWDPWSDPKGENYFNCVLDEKEDRSVVELYSGVMTNGKGGGVIASNMQKALQACRTFGVRGGPDRPTRDKSTQALKEIVAKTFNLKLPQ